MEARLDKFSGSILVLRPKRPRALTIAICAHLALHGGLIVSLASHIFGFFEDALPLRISHRVLLQSRRQTTQCQVNSSTRRYEGLRRCERSPGGRQRVVGAIEVHSGDHSRIDERTEVLEARDGPDRSFLEAVLDACSQIPKGRRTDQAICAAGKSPPLQPLIRTAIKVFEARSVRYPPASLAAEMTASGSHAVSFARS